MLGFGAARLTPIDIFRFARAKVIGLPFYSWADLIRSKKQQRLETEPLVRVAMNENGIHLWPHEDFRNQAMLEAIAGVFGPFGFGVHYHGPRRLTERELRRLRKTFSEKFIAQSMPDGSKWLEVPLEIRLEPDETEDLRTGLGAGAEWKSLKEIRDIVSLVRMGHLPPHMSGYEYFM